MNGRFINSFFIITIKIGVLLITGCQTTTIKDQNTDVKFIEVSKQVGVHTTPTMKYGGPAVSDINNDGLYDFLLTNHDQTPIQLFIANENHTYTKQNDIFPRADLHGIAAGDYDLDGDNDVLISLGGGNGLKPQPQRLLRNDNGKFKDVTVESGLSEMGARGRTVRWVDIDNDGDLDFLQVNAGKVVNENMPRHIIFENLGNGKFSYKSSPSIEELDFDRVLLTDFNNDNVIDIIGFNPSITFLQGHGDFTFTQVYQDVVALDNSFSTLAAAQFDLDNDGDLDYYFARGKSYYKMANNNISFDKVTKRLDLRDQGSISHDGITIYSKGGITISDMFHWKRGNAFKHIPVYLGVQKEKILPPMAPVKFNPQRAQGFPKYIEKTGWYIGYLGNDKWRVEWVLKDNVAWDLRASFIGVEHYETNFSANEMATEDVLLRNDGDKLVNISNQLPKETIHNNWGVSTGDFNNDGFTDLFIYRFGKLTSREYDLLLMNKNGKLSPIWAKTATTAIGSNSHGDMGVAADFNLDGKIDLLNGDDDLGLWHMYHNHSENDNHYLLTRIGYSPKGVDPLGARINAYAKDRVYTRLIGSTNASHSQSLLNIAHFGLGDIEQLDKVVVRWRDGTETQLENINADQLLVIGEFPHTN